MRDHDRLLSGRLSARFPKVAQKRAAAALSAALSQVMATATRDSELAGDDDALLDGMDAFRLLRALAEELNAD